MRVVALASLGFKDVIEKVAFQQLDAWRQAHAGAVARMPRSVRDLIEPLWYTGHSHDDSHDGGGPGTGSVEFQGQAQ